MDIITHLVAIIPDHIRLIGPVFTILRLVAWATTGTFYEDGSIGYP